MNITRLSIEDLCKELRDRGLRTTGARSVLLKRLRKHLDESAQASTSTPASTPALAPVPTTTSVPPSTSVHAATSSKSSTYVRASTNFHSSKSTAVSISTKASMSTPARAKPLTTVPCVKATKIFSSPKDTSSKTPAPKTTPDSLSLVLSSTEKPIANTNKRPVSPCAPPFVSFNESDPPSKCNAVKDRKNSSSEAPDTRNEATPTTPPSGPETQEESQKEAIARRHKRFGLPPPLERVADPTGSRIVDQDKMAELIRRRHERFGTGSNRAIQSRSKETAEEEEMAELVRLRRQRFGTGLQEHKNISEKTPYREVGKAAKGKRDHDRQALSEKKTAHVTVKHVSNSVGLGLKGAGRNKRRHDNVDDDVYPGRTSKRRVDDRAEYQAIIHNEHCDDGWVYRREGGGREDRRTVSHNERREERDKGGHVRADRCRDGRIDKATGRGNVRLRRGGHSDRKKDTVAAHGLRRKEKEGWRAVPHTATLRDDQGVERPGIAIQDEEVRRRLERFGGDADAVKRGAIRGPMLDGIPADEKEHRLKRQRRFQR